MQIYFALLLITLNVPQVGNPWSRHLHFRSFQSELWSYASAQFRKL